MKAHWTHDSSRRDRAPAFPGEGRRPSSGQADPDARRAPGWRQGHRPMPPIVILSSVV
ncbi:hypothetical protein [Nonomuraea dietziae]|uniref:hypothetical protein n=1 Tax=Nonomuraea dietziae TaxID=65515 RepID=UPI0031DC9F72